jgi:hypothetical protein
LANPFYRDPQWAKAHPFLIGPRKEVNEHIYVHMIPHTHDDVGWLKTVDEYYTGGSGDPNRYVEGIIHTAFEEVQKNPERKFTYVEMKFFETWWTR